MRPKLTTEELIRAVYAVSVRVTLLPLLYALAVPTAKLVWRADDCEGEASNMSVSAAHKLT